jgi:hypothetical protein
VRFRVSDTSLTRGQKVQRSNITAQRYSGSLLSLVEDHDQMVVEVFCCDQTLPRKPGSRPT